MRRSLLKPGSDTARERPMRRASPCGDVVHSAIAATTSAEYSGPMGQAAMSPTEGCAHAWAGRAETIGHHRASSRASRTRHGPRSAHDRLCGCQPSAPPYARRHRPGGHRRPLQHRSGRCPGRDRQPAQCHRWLFLVIAVVSCRKDCPISTPGTHLSPIRVLQAGSGPLAGQLGGLVGVSHGSAPVPVADLS